MLENLGNIGNIGDFLGGVGVVITFLYLAIPESSSHPTGQEVGTL